ncbi:MAG: radical SAM family heme chaperone HemW [Bacilli bacterium]
MSTNSVYVHIPFCDKLCNYCDFTKVLNYSKFVDKYLDALENEMKSVYLGEKIRTIYIGGGTPSCLTITELERLFKILNLLNIEDDYEFTFEMNIESTTLEKLQFLKDQGVNRLSLGVQTFNDKLLKIINRSHHQLEVGRVIASAKQVGFSNISIDLMFNLPSQTESDLESDLNYFLDLELSHISIYSLILEEKTIFYKNSVAVDYDMFELWYYKIKTCLENHNYIHYETSSFCKKGFESKHNLVYWECENYYGFGLGSSSYIDNIRSQNTTSITLYNRMNYDRESDVLTKLDQMQEYMFLGLRKTKGVCFSKFYDRFNEEISSVFDLEKIDSNLIEITSDYIKLSNGGLVVANDVLINFV